MLAKLVAVPEKDLQAALEESKTEMDDGAGDGDDDEEDKEDEEEDNDGDLPGANLPAPELALSDAVHG